MSDVFAQITDVLKQKRRRDKWRSAEFVLRRADPLSFEDCDVRVPRKYRFGPLEPGDDGREDCGRPAAFELRGNVKFTVCSEHLAFVSDLLLVEERDDMEAHFGRHSSVLHHRECAERPKRKAGDPFVAVKRCTACTWAQEAEDQARARNTRRKMQAAARRKSR